MNSTHGWDSIMSFSSQPVGSGSGPASGLDSPPSPLSHREAIRVARRIVAGPTFNGTSCWLWTGSVWRGYGYMYFRGKWPATHRVTYEATRGAIPNGLVIDHLCRVRNCANPMHMEAVTDKINVLRGTGPTARLARQTHCLRGHEFASANLHILPNGRRRCKACALWREAQYRAQRRRTQ